MKCLRLQILVVVACVASGCNSAKVDYSRVLLPAPVPSEEETGGLDTAFYFEVVRRSGGAGDEVFIVTTNTTLDVTKYTPGPRQTGSHVEFAEAYVVSENVAISIDNIIRSDLVGLRSMLDASLTDGVSWNVSFKTASGRQRIIVSEFRDRVVFPDLRQAGPAGTGTTDDELGRFAQRVFGAVRRIQMLARDDGTRIRFGGAQKVLGKRAEKLSGTNGT